MMTIHISNAYRRYTNGS